MESLSSPFQTPPMVLLVEDNAAIRHVVAWSLHIGGFQPIEAADGLAAVAWMELSAKELLSPSVILLDLAMPVMDGYAFLEWLHVSWGSHFPLPIVIVITANDIDDQALMPFPMVKQIIQKPFHLHDLLESIRRWVAPLE